MLINFRTEEVLCFQLTELDVALETELDVAEAKPHHFSNRRSTLLRVN